MSIQLQLTRDKTRREQRRESTACPHFWRVTRIGATVLLLLLLVACDEPPEVPGLVYWDSVADIQNSINAHRQYNPTNQSVTVGDAGVVPAFSFDGTTDTSGGEPRSFATIQWVAGGTGREQEYSAKVYLFPGKGDLDYFNKPLVVGDALDPYNERGARLIYEDAQYSRLLSPKNFYPRGLGYDIFFIDFSQGAGDILVNASLELDFVQWLQDRLDPGANILIGGPSMSGIVARVAMLYALPENNTTGVNLAARVTGYLSIDSPHQGASLDPSLTIAARAFYEEMADGWGASHKQAAKWALYSWQQSTTPATFQMLYGHEYLNEASPQTTGHDLFYGFIEEMGQFNTRMPRTAIAYSNFFVPHQGIDPTKRQVVGQFKVRVKVPFNPIDFTQDFFAGGSPAPGASAAEQAGYYEFTPGSVGGRFYWSLYNGVSVSDYVKPNTLANGEVYKGTHIPINSALDLDPTFDIFNPPTTDETEMARYSSFDAVYYMKNEFNGYRANGTTVNDKRYEHIVFDDQLMQSVADALAYLEARGAEPVAASDRYDILRGRQTYINPPGVLANDVAINGSPAVYALTGVSQGGYLSESVEQGAYASLDYERCSKCGQAFTVVMVGAEKRFLYLNASVDTGEINIVSSPVIDLQDRQNLTKELNAPLPAANSPLATTMVNGDARVYYLVGDTRHVQELAWFAGSWHTLDVSADAGAIAAVPGSPVAATSITNGNPRVYYFTSHDGAIHIQELAWRTLGTAWSQNDLTASTGAPSPLPDSPIVAIAVDSEPRVYYIGPGPNIYELAWDVDHWRWSMITSFSSPLLRHRKLAAVAIDNKPRVYFVADGSAQRNVVWELAYTGASWLMSNIGEPIGANAVYGPSLVATNVNGEPHVYYTSRGDPIGGVASQNIYTLSLTDGVWRRSDLTTPHHNGHPYWAVTTDETLTLRAMAIDSPTLKAELVTDVAHGELALFEDGSFVYQPRAGFVGGDSFTYRVRSGDVVSPETRVLLQVTDEGAPEPDNLVLNPDFERTVDPWLLYSNRFADFRLSQQEPFDGQSSASITIRQQNRNIQMFQKGIALQPNTTYQLSFAARSSDGRNMTVWLHKHGDPYISYGLAGHVVRLETNWQWYTVTFVTPDYADMNNARLRFSFGALAIPGTVFQIDHVILASVD